MNIKKTTEIYKNCVECKKILGGDQGKMLTKIVFHPSGKRLITAFNDSTLMLQEIDSGDYIWTIDDSGGWFSRLYHSGWLSDFFYTGALGIYAVAFSGDGNYLVTSSGDDAKVWNAHSGNHVATLKGHDEILSIVFSPDGKFGGARLGSDG